jgi:hypothetical protein
VANNYKTGMVALTKLVEHGCRLFTRYSPSMFSVLAASRTAGTITSAEYDTATLFINTLTSACAVFKKVTGY